MTSNSRPLSLARFAAIVSTVSLLAVGVALVVFGFHERNWALVIGLDRATYSDGAQRWLNGGSFYLDRQLHGPYEIHMGDVLYPPTLPWLLIALSFLPALVWWAVPIGFHRVERLGLATGHLVVAAARPVPCLAEHDRCLRDRLPWPPGHVPRSRWA